MGIGTGAWIAIAASGRMREFVCGYCGAQVHSGEGWVDQGSARDVRVCPSCCCASMFFGSLQFPGAADGDKIAHLPSDLDALYLEAIRSLNAFAATACALTCRKILMHVAVEKGAKRGETFETCVRHLVSTRCVPAAGLKWLSFVRKHGNEANHELVLFTHNDGRRMLWFTQVLLRFVYELPCVHPGAVV